MIVSTPPPGFTTSTRCFGAQEVVVITVITVIAAMTLMTQ